jgi:hypothetical protein
MPINSYKDYLQNTYKPYNIKMMKCEKARTFFPILAAQRLQGSDKTEVELHVSGCPECTTALEKTRKLQSLLGLKKHEQPDEFFLRTYVSEFHRRLYTEVVQERSLGFWSKMVEKFSFQISWPIAAQTLAVILVLGTIGHHFYFSSSSPAAVAMFKNFSKLTKTDSVVEVESRVNELVVSNKSDQNSVYVLDRVSYKPSNNGSVVLQF